MSLARRLLSLVQANLGAWFGHHGGETTLDQFPEDEMAPARNSRRSTAARVKRPRPQTAPRRVVRPPAPQMVSLYAVLEVPAGSDLETVKRSFRRLMRLYHPDLYTGDPERTRAATEKVQRLTLAYAELVRLLGSP